MIKRSISLGCVVFGAALLYIGYGKTRSVMGGLTKTFSGGYSAQTIAYLIGGGVLIMMGLVMLLGKKKKK